MTSKITREMVVDWAVKVNPEMNRRITACATTDLEEFAKLAYSAGAASMKERAAKLEPEPPAEVKGRVMSEWWWRGIMAMHREIKALSDLEE